MLLLTLALAAQDPDIAEVRAWLADLPEPRDDTPLLGSYRFARPALEPLLDLAEERPGIVDVEVIGHSGAGAPLVAFHVQDPTAPVTDEVLVIAGLHALEWIGTESALTVLEEHVLRPRSGLRLTVVPLANPDGRARVETDLLTDNVYAYRRGNQALVDLNRDFAHGRDARAVWRKVIPGRYATSPAPLSQPESQALDQLAAEHAYRAVVSLHAFGGYLYHPWSSSWSRPDDWDAYVVTGRCMEQAQGAGAFRTRQLARWGFFFRAHGTELDHFHGSYRSQSWLIEISRSGIARPSDRRTPFRWYNPRHREPHVERTTAALDALLGNGPCRLPPG